jgi:alpha-tubulin suppressor-like RCC1 family protein
MHAPKRITSVLVPVVLALAASLGLAGAPSSAAAVSRATGTARVTGTVSATGVVTAQAWGDNSAGELGNGTFSQQDSPVPVASLSGIKAISAGGRHNLALLANGTVMSWGDDAFGQLGNGTVSANNDAELPVAVTGVTNAVQVAAGGEHSLALLANGTVVAWGDNGNGQLGDGNTTDSDVPVAVKGLTKVRAVAAGDLFSVAVLANGTVMSWGYNGNGQLGDGTYNDSDVPVAVTGLTNASAVAAGGQFAVALLTNGTAMSWGNNESGQLGSGNMNSGSSDVPVPVQGLTGATDISAGYQHVLAVVADGAVMGWGDNSFNQLAQSNDFPGGISNSDVPIPIAGVGQASAVSAGALFSLALLTNGTVMGWGDGAFGQLGNGTTNTLITPTAVTGLTGVQAISAGGAYAAALISSAPAQTSAATPSIWHVVNTPDLGGTTVSNYTFAAVSAASATDAWAVGTSEVSGDLPLAEHWNGTAWSHVAIPVATTVGQAELNGVDDLSPTNAWAVGDFEETGTTNELTLIEHWNGTAWTVVPSPNPGTGTGSADVLTAIDGVGPNDLWAVGYFDIGGEFNALLFEHWNGTAWSFVPPPEESGEQFATAVTAITSNDVWVVGNVGFNQATVAANWNGTSWQEVTTPTLQTTDSTNFLTGVSADGANDVWASGYEGNVNDTNFDQPYMLHWTGTSWQLVELPDAGSEGSSLAGDTVLSPTDVWAVGRTGESDGGALALTEHFNGTTWSIKPGLDPGQLEALPQNGLDAIASLGTSVSTSATGVVWAVGFQEIPGECCLRTLALATSSG